MQWLIYLLIGAGLGAWIWHWHIADYPPPDALKRLWLMIPAGAVGALVAGALIPRASSDPMPGTAGELVTVVATALLATGLAGMGIGLANKTHTQR